MTWVLLRKRDVELTIEDVTAPSDDPREYAALRHNLDQVRRELEQEALRGAIRLDEVRHSYEDSPSWRITRPLRAIKGVVGRRRKRGG
jgi:hypothetical protein